MFTVYRHSLIKVLVLIFSFSLMLIIVHRPPIYPCIDLLKKAEMAVPASIDNSIQAQKNDSGDFSYIENEINNLANKIDQEPIDARIDGVWKAIPGYNGLQVDRQKSVEIAKQIGSVQLDMLVVAEIEPTIMLDDLPPAPIYRGNPQKPMVSFMINVAWGTEYLPDMLHILDEHDVKVTFFLDGQWLKRNSEIAEEMLSRGHDIGNHAYSHPNLQKISSQEIRQELLKTEELIQKLDKQSDLFAPPSGAYDDRVVKITHSLNMSTILWTLDTVDWKNPSPEQIVQRIVPNLENGALILMHPTESTVAALPQLITGALEQELMLGTVSELISPERTLSIVRLD